MTQWKPGIPFVPQPEPILPGQGEVVPRPELPRDEVVPRPEPQVIELIPYSWSVPATLLIRLREYAPFSGVIKQVILHFPDGCNALLDIRVGHGTKQFCPNAGFLALNDATVPYYFEEEVKDKEEIWVELGNYDVLAHNITVTVGLAGRRD